MRAEAGGRVDRVPERCVLQAAARAHHADDSGPRVDAYAPADGRQALSEQSLLQLGSAVDQVVRAAHREQRMVFLQAGCVPERDDLVADVLVDGPIPREDDSAQVVEVHLDDLGHVVRRHRLRHRGEAADIDEQKCHVAPLSTPHDVVHAAASPGQLGHDLGLEVDTEQSRHLAFLAVLVQVSIGGHPGVGEPDGEPRMKQVWNDPNVVGERRHPDCENDHGDGSREKTPQDRHTRHCQRHE